MRRPAIVAATFLLTLSACTASGGSQPPVSIEQAPHGGTLRVVTLPDAPGIFDPQRAYKMEPWEVFRCCLLRTLLSYGGRPTEQGGALVQADLATSMPRVSTDGLSWSFHLRGGIRYGPPFQDTEIVSGDIVRAITREADPSVADGSGDQNGGYPYLFSGIDGFDAYRAGEADSIAGLETPDDRTLVVRLTEPEGDLPYLFAMPATAPIPRGAPNGHLDYGRYLVASGPYMFQGSADLDFSVPPMKQQPVSGYVPSTFRSVAFQSAELRRPGALTLVRNPSWDPSTDTLRGAFVDRIDVRVVRTTKEAESLIDRGSADVFLSLPTWGQKALNVDRYRSDPDLATRLLVTRGNTFGFLPMNVAMPPFDDVHVRKAVVFALDREALARIASDPWGGARLSAHAAPDSAEGGLLVNYDPYPHHSGDLRAARDEMRRSRYDRDGDGRCDTAECRAVPALGFAGLGSSDFGESELIRRDLGRIGIRLDVTMATEAWPGPRSFYGAITTGRYGITVSVLDGWAVDYPNGSQFFGPMFRSDGPIGPQMFLGADAKRLRAAGLPATRVPTEDARVERCAGLTGAPQMHCWADLDQYLMEQVVPLVPVVVNVQATITSERVIRRSIDQFTGMPALDQFALAPPS